MRLAALALGLLALLLPAPALADPTWTWPLPGPEQVSRPFAPGVTRYSPGHRGADLPGSAGQAVRAARSGRVSYAGMLAGRGVVVVVHGALRTTYEPVLASVRAGQPVTAGQQIGTLAAGHAGCPVEACLHWGLRRGADYLDPVRLVRGGPVRLLPLTGAPSGGRGAGSVPGGVPAASGPALRANPPVLTLVAGAVPAGRGRALSASAGPDERPTAASGGKDSASPVPAPPGRSFGPAPEEPGTRTPDRPTATGHGASPPSAAASPRPGGPAAGSAAPLAGLGLTAAALLAVRRRTSRGA